MDKKQIRAAKIKRQQELLDAAKKAGNRSLTDTEQAEFGSLQREIDTLTEEIRAAENPQTPADPAPAQNPTPAAPANANRSTDPAPRPRRLISSGLLQQSAPASTRSPRCAVTSAFPSRTISRTAAPWSRSVQPSWITCARTAHPSARGIQITDSGEDEFRRDAADGLLIRSGMNPERLPMAHSRWQT
mgnify:CR=1 FL=1